MVSGFSKRKIKTQATLGDLLKEVRQKKELNLDEAETATKVRAKFLSALENGRWQDLPADVYVRGFVLAYAKYLGIDLSKALALYEQETRLRKRGISSMLTYENKVHDLKLLITPKLLGYFALILSITGMFGYIYYQVQNFAGNPNLKVVAPYNNAIFEDDSIEIKGVTDTDTKLQVNDEGIPVTNDGHFSSNLKLHRGINVIHVTAINKAKKETSQTLTIEYKPKTAQIVETKKQ